VGESLNTSPGQAGQVAFAPVGNGQMIADLLIWVIVLLGPFILLGGLILAIVRGVLKNRKAGPSN